MICHVLSSPHTRTLNSTSNATTLLYQSIYTAIFKYPIFNLNLQCRPSAMIIFS